MKYLKTEKMFSVLRCEMLLRNVKYVPRETAGHMKYPHKADMIAAVTDDGSCKACVEAMVSVKSKCSDTGNGR